MFNRNPIFAGARIALLLTLIVGLVGVTPAAAQVNRGMPESDTSTIAIQIHTPDYPVPINTEESKLVPFTIAATEGISGAITDRTYQFFTQYDVPLSGPFGPFPVSVSIDSSGNASWNEAVYLPKAVANEARAIKDYAIVLRSTFNGRLQTGERFSANSSLLLLLPPDAFSKVSPSNGAIVQPGDQSLQWNSSVGAVDYEYCFDSVDNDSCDSNWTGTYWLGTYDTNAALQNLPPGTTVFWQVRANNTSGTTYANNGDWWAFTTASSQFHMVTKTADTDDGVCDSDCSLREAISAAVHGDTITFDPSLSGQTITLSSTLFIDKDLTIDGSALNSRIRISGNNSVGVMETHSSNGITLDSLLVQDGYHWWGGGIGNQGVLTLVNCVISNNHSDYNGGGVANVGELTLINTTISENTAGSDGGGIYNDSYGWGGKLTITDSVIANNTADYGGGIYSTGVIGVVVTVINSNFSNNSAVFADGGGISNSGTLEVLNSTFSWNTANGDGGAIYNSHESTLTVIGSTFSENSAGAQNAINGWGGALYNGDYGVMNVTNSTFVKNVAGSGGAIFNYGNPIGTTTVTITNSTFSENSAVLGGSVFNMGTLNLANSILANSTTGTDCYHQDINGGTIGTNINNLIETNASPPHSCGTALLASDPNLGTLTNNGGFTQTMALLPGSPAIDAGDAANCPSTDQRGVTRPQGSGCDIGAYEYEFQSLPTPTNTSTLTSTPVTPTATHTFTPHPPTITFTPSSTITATATRTATVSGKPTKTNTPSRTPSVTLTRTPITPTATHTFTPHPPTITFTPTSTATATEVVSTPADITKSFSPISIPSGGISRLSVSIFNPNPFALTNAALTDNLPAGITIANPAGLTNSCGGVVNAVSGGTSLTLTGGSVPAQAGSSPGSCTVAINVTSNTPGNMINTIPANALITGNGVTNSTPASATLTVIPVTVTPSATATRTATVGGKPTKTNTPSRTPSPTRTSVNTSTYTPTLSPTTTEVSVTPTFTFTPSPTISSGFPTTVVRDTFNRANGPIGNNWYGNPSAFSIASNQLDVTASGSNTFILWKSSSFGADQEAYVTLTQIDTAAGNEHRLILKSQNSKNVTSGSISVQYDAAGQTVQVWTYHPTQGWVQHGTSIPVTFVNGDQFGARARPDGTVEVYRNGTLVATWSITSWPLYSSGGYVGMWFVNAPNALLDNFGGGTR